MRGGYPDTRLQLVLAGIAAIGTVVMLSALLPHNTGVDWYETFRPATLSLLTTGDPFRIPSFLNPPWVLLIFVPFAWLPAHIGRAILLTASLAAYAYAGHKLGAKPVVLAAFMVSPPVLHTLINGNIDWLPLLGFVLPPQIGLFLVAAKPQMGWVVALFWLIESWRIGGWREVLRVFGPVTAALVVTFLLYGLYPLRFGYSLQFNRNTSLWPLSIPVGLALAVSAIRQREIRYAIGASPCLSPYLILHSWVGALAAILKYPAEALAAIAGLWILVIIFAQ